jgi:transcriptional regulator with XRE-family HTH domain
MGTAVKSFADLLRAARKHVGLTQRELADQVGIDDSYISRMEQGKAPAPVREKVLALADALAITDKAERATFLLAAGSASLDELEGLTLITHPPSSKRQRAPLIFGSSTMNFPQPKRMEQENLVRNLRELLQMAEADDKKWDQTVMLLRSFFTWLKFRIEEES